MSDLFMYELQDNIWDEFGESGDHIVPRPGDEDENKCAVRGDTCKKARHRDIDMTDSANNATNYAIHGKEENMTKNEMMLETGSWSQTPDESIGELSGITRNNSRIPGHCLKGDNIGSVGNGFCANNPILADCKSNTYDYALSHISQTDNELSFYDKDGEDKASSDILNYEWPDIGNFEDVDRMFRSCDSTFGLGSLSKDELCWFPSSHATEEPKEAENADFDFSCPQSIVCEQNAHSVQNNAGALINNSDRKYVSLSNNGSCQTTDADDLHMQMVNESGAKSENRSQPVQKGQISLQRKQSKHHGRPDRKRKNLYSENGGSFHHSIDPKPFGDMKHSFEDSSESNQLFSPTDIGQRKQNLQKHAPYMHLDFSNPSDQISVPSLSEHNRHPSPSLKQKHQSGNSHSEVEGAGNPAETDSSNVQESTCMSASPQATSFRQLQQVVGQLDIRTKMCIRDSLYRLARSAEQRHSYLNPSGSFSNDRDVNGVLVADETNKCTGFMDIETNTNPIDRSIAHLLFHRPQDHSVMPANDATSLKSHSMVHESILSPPMLSEKQIFQEIANGTDDKLLKDGEK